MILGIALPLKTRALTQFIHINPTGVAMLNGRVIVTTATGIFALDDPESDDGTKIVARFDTIKTDLGINNAKRLRSIFLRGYFKNLLVGTRTEATEEYTSARLDSKVNAVAQQAGYVPCMRDVAGTYFQIRVSNYDGQDFSVDAIDVLPIVLSAKRGQSRT